MQITTFNVILTLAYLICIAYGQEIKYEIEFLEEGIFKACEKYPDKFIDRIFDISNANFEQTEDGSLILKGYYTAKASIKPPQLGYVEMFKKVRGTWQPTLVTVKRPDFCTAAFDESEGWHPYVKHIPIAQHKCPITEGQRFDVDISEPTMVSLPMYNAEGEYRLHVEGGDRTSELLFCIDIPIMLHKV